MNSRQQIKLGAVLSYFAILVNIATGILYTPWMIRCIGREEFGLYTLAMSVISLFVFDFGLSSAVTRYISKYLAKGEEEKANNVLQQQKDEDASKNNEVDSTPVTDEKIDDNTNLTDVLGGILGESYTQAL